MSLLHDDCLRGMRALEDDTVDMIYLDPPFCTQKRHEMKDAAGSAHSFSDVWESRQAYLAFLRERLVEMRRVLKDTGSLFFHCDATSSHYIRALLDEIFGEDNFQSEIIWTYRRWSNSKKGLLPGHQTIFFYSKSDRFKFHTIYGEYSPTTNLDQILQLRARNAMGKSSYKCDEEGNVIMAKEKRGVPMTDVWDIPFLNPKAKERVGYPTQKPVELLQRIIRLSTDEGDVVLDPFCGSGTTLVAAKYTMRRYMGMDVNADAIELSRARLCAPVITESRLLKIGAMSYHTKSPEEMAILSQFECDIVQRNKGIDAFLKKYYLDAPVAIKIQKQTESIHEAIALLHAAGEKRKCSFTVLIVRGGEYPLLEGLAPENMIIINSHNSEVERRLSERIGMRQKESLFRAM